MNQKSNMLKRNLGILFGAFLLTVVIAGTGLGFLLYRFYAYPIPQNIVTSSPTENLTETPTIPIITETPTLIVTLTPEITATPTPEALVTAGVTTYAVQAGDTLSGIAERFGTSVEAIKQANALTSDLIYVGASLVIPPPPATPTLAANQYRVAFGDSVASIAAVYNISPEDLRAANFSYGDALLPGQLIVILNTPVPLPPYHFSILEGDLAAAYPRTLSTGRFTLHYTPNTFPAQDPQAVYAMIERSVANIESVFQIQLGGTFDVYVAGTLFEPPNRPLRGMSYSVFRRSFFLHDGSGDATDQQYISAHELTHLFTWNTFGQPSSTMLSEGAAVYSGMSAISASNYIPLSLFCAAYRKQNQLPVISGALSFSGHIYDLQNYYAAGCFVGYLIQTYGVQAFGQVYPSGDFAGVYGRSLYALEQDWIAPLDTVQIPAEFDTARLVGAVQNLETSYQSFMPAFYGTLGQLKAYRELDLARLALLRGNFDEMDSHLDAFRQMLNTP